MDKVSICHACGRTIESAFIFCPWCGTAVVSADLLPDWIDSAFEEVESIQAQHACSRISRMEKELGDIEKALSLLLAGERTH